VPVDRLVGLLRATAVNHVNYHTAMPLGALRAPRLGRSSVGTSNAWNAQRGRARCLRLSALGVEKDAREIRRLALVARAGKGRGNSHDRAAEPERTSSESASPISGVLLPGRHPDDKQIFTLALPAALALAADPLLQVVDTAFVGHAGPEALAALGINSALFTFSFLVFNFLGTATTPLVARAKSSKNETRAGMVTLQALLVATVCGTLLTIGLLLGSDAALELMGADPEGGASTYEMAKQFLLIRALAAPAVMLCTVGQGVFGGLQDMKTPLGITLSANAINLTLDVVLILGLGWGVRGAACATTIAEWTAASSYLYFLWNRRDSLGGAAAPEAMKRMTPRELIGSFTPFFSAGGAVLMRTVLLLGTKTMASATAARLGSTAIASHQVVMQLWLLTSMLVDSLAVSGQSMVAVEFGKAKIDCLQKLDNKLDTKLDNKAPEENVVTMDTTGARRVASRLLQLGVGSGILLAGVFTVTSPVLPKLFTDDAQVTESIGMILPIAVAMLPVNGAVYVLDGILVGSRDFKWMAMAMSLAAGCVLAFLTAVEPLDLGLPGVWYALAGLMVLRMATLVWRYESKDGPFAKKGIPLDLNVLGSMDSFDSGITVDEDVEDAASNIMLVDTRPRKERSISE
jgi:putative MATE family efflux protein